MSVPIGVCRTEDSGDGVEDGEEELVILCDYCLEDLSDPAVEAEHDKYCTKQLANCRPEKQKQTVSAPTIIETPSPPLASQIKQAKEKKLKYTCKLCDEKFRHKSDYKAHKKTHVIVPTVDSKQDTIVRGKKFPFNCKHCGEGFTTVKPYLDHRKQQHETAEDRLCPKCGMSFPTAFRLNYHVINNVCSKQKAKTRRREVVTSAYCEICDRLFNTKGGLDIHMQSCHQLKNARLDTGPAGQISVKQEIFEASPDTDHSRDTDDKLERRKRADVQLPDARPAKKKVKRDAETANTSSFKESDEQIKNLHSNAKDLKSVLDSGGEIKLEPVDMNEFNANIGSYLQSHLTDPSFGKRYAECKDEGKPQAAPPPPPPPPPPQMRYGCGICERTFAEVSHLRTHQKVHTTDPALTCDVCHKSYPDKYKLFYHKKYVCGKPAKGKYVAVTKKPVDCGLCGVTCMSEFRLRYHMMQTHKVNMADDTSQAATQS